jgi:hypothetical protein
MYILVKLLAIARKVIALQTPADGFCTDHLPALAKPVVPSGSVAKLPNHFVNNPLRGDRVLSSGGNCPLSPLDK